MLEFEYLDPISLNSAFNSLPDGASSSCALNSEKPAKEDIIEPALLSEIIFQLYILPLKNFYYDKKNAKCQKIFKSLCQFEADLKTFSLKELQELKQLLDGQLGSLEATINNFSVYFNVLNYEFMNRRPVLGKQAEGAKNKEAVAEELSRVYAFYKANYNSRLHNAGLNSLAATKIVLQVAKWRGTQNREKSVDFDDFKKKLLYVQEEINNYKKAYESPKGFVESMKYVFGRNRTRAYMMQDLESICQIGKQLEERELPKSKLDFQDFIEDVLLLKLNQIKQELVKEQGNLFKSQFLTSINKLQAHLNDDFTNEKQVVESLRLKSLKKQDNAIDLKAFNSLLDSVTTVLNNYEAKFKKPQNFVDSVKYVLGPNRSRAGMLAEIREICQQGERLKTELKAGDDIDFQDFIKGVLLSKLKSVKLELLQENNLFSSHFLNSVSELVQKIDNCQNNSPALKK